MLTRYSIMERISTPPIRVTHGFIAFPGGLKRSLSRLQCCQRNSNVRHDNASKTSFSVESILFFSIVQNARHSCLDTHTYRGRTVEMLSICAPVEND